MKKRKTKKPAYIFALLVMCVTFSSVYGWVFFVTADGQRLQWVFEQSCNPEPAPIRLIADRSFLSSFSETNTEQMFARVVEQWNLPERSDEIDSSTETTEALNLFTAGGISSSHFTSEYVMNYLENPQANEIHVVYDRDSSILRSLGIGSAGILGIGIPLNMNAERRHDICSGLVILNGGSINGVPHIEQTLLHEIGHTLGFAHSISGGNRDGMVRAQSNEHIPVMFPFALNEAPTTLRPDDRAGLRAVYGNIE